MKKPLQKIIRQARDFASMVSGGKPTALLLAQEKRAYERGIRAQGHSRAEAVALVSQRYQRRG